MKKMVLLYNFSGERLSGVKRALIPLKAIAKEVEKAAYGEKLGCLVGAEGYAPTGAAAEDFAEELLVMSGFDGNDIEQLIHGLRKYGVGRVALKAVITPTNIDWNSRSRGNAEEESGGQVRCIIPICCCAGITRFIRALPPIRSAGSMNIVTAARRQNIPVPIKRNR